MKVKGLGHKQQRSMFPQKSPFYPPFRAILPPFCHPVGFESRRGQPLSGTQGKRVATFALVTTVGPEMRPARSTSGEPGRAADRQAFASLSYPPNRQVLHNPHVGRPGFLVSTSMHLRTAVRRGRHACLLLLLRKSAPGRPLRARIVPSPLTAEARLGSMRWVLASYAASLRGVRLTW